MYEKHFNFSASPFTIAPNPRYLYLTGQHREALAHLTYGLQEKGGFVLLTGEVGTGKTTVCRCLLGRIPDRVELAVILTPTLGVEELLESICREFGIEIGQGATVGTLTDALHRYLLDVHARGRRAVVMIDEAQNLDVQVLEQLRLLTNLETDEAKLLQIILIGQPEFLQKLERPELRQLSQRIVARFHLGALQAGEVRAYIDHRLGLVGGSTAIFPSSVVSRIARLSRGVPRLINLLCDRALLGCYVQNRHRVDLRTLRHAAREVLGGPVAAGRTRRRYTRYLPVSAKSVSFAAAAASVLLAGVVLVRFDPAWWRDLSSAVEAVTAQVASQTVTTASDPAVLGEPVAGRVDDHLPLDSPGTVSPVPVDADAMPATVSGQPPVPLTWLALVDASPTEADAYRALFRQWDMDYSPGDGKTPCQLAVENQLDCWHKSGEFHDLRRLNRPVVLKMISDVGDPFYAALLVVDGDTLRVGIGERSAEVRLTRFRRAWTGEYTVLWKRPPGFIRTLRPGTASDFTAWVGERLARFDGRKVGVRQSRGGSRVYDFNMSARVRVLQRRCGLAADGLVGRETVILINSLLSGAPLLSGQFNRQCKRQFNV